MPLRGNLVATWIELLPPHPQPPIPKVHCELQYSGDTPAWGQVELGNRTPEGRVVVSQRWSVQSSGLFGRKMIVPTLVPPLHWPQTPRDIAETAGQVGGKSLSRG